MQLRGFAMADGISFTNGKLRLTGRKLKNGEIEFKEGGSWLWRFSIRQRIAIAMLLIVTGIDYGWNGFNDFWLYILYILIAPFIFHLSFLQKKYHGAEHMAVNLFEGRAPSIFHPGCGSNLVLMFLPGLIFEILPLNLWTSLICEIVYVLLVLKIIWPAFQYGVRAGNPWANFWWALSRKWQRFFVVEPNEEELLLAINTLDKLLKNDDK